MTYLYDTILAYLTANWQIGTEDDPKFYNNQKVNVDSLTHNAVGIEVLKSDNQYNTFTADKDDSPFLIVCNCLDQATRDSYVAEVRALMKAYRGTPGWWAVTNITYSDKKDFPAAYVWCIEKKIS